MIASALEHIAGGLALIYGRPLGYDAAVVFLVAFALTVVIAARQRAWMSQALSSRGGVGLRAARGAPALLATTSVVLRSGPLRLAGVLAMILTWGVHLLPPAVGIHFIVQGEIARGLIYSALAVLWTQAFVTLLPFWFVAGWYEYGLWVSLAANGLMFLALSAPGWLLSKPHHVDRGRPTPARARSAKED